MSNVNAKDASLQSTAIEPSLAMEYSVPVNVRVH